jgi:CheY-like chemotaxis protein
MTRILVVEGAVPALARELAFLERGGGDVLTAAGGDALGRARQCRPDLVLIDAGSFYAVDAGLRTAADPDLGRTPVVFVGDRDDEGRLRAAGVRRFLPRPDGRGAWIDALRAFVPVEARSSHRQASALPVAFAGGGTGGVSYTRDVSTTGMYLRTERPVEVGQRVRLHVRLRPDDATALRVLGVVVRRAVDGGGTGIGVRLDGLGADDRGRIAARLAEAP